MDAVQSPEEKRWNELSPEWEQCIGDDGDTNRIECSDNVLWELIKVATGERDTSNLTVLDAGCGTGYLTTKLAKQGYNVIGVDVSSNQLGFAEKRVSKFEMNHKVKLIRESLDSMVSVESNSIDIVVSNYVLMDLEKYDDAIKEIHRVMKPSGKAVIIFLHPCFSSPKLSKESDKSKWIYWPHKNHQQNYFKENMYETSWGPFSHPFIHYHRPLSSYWKSFTNNNLNIKMFDEIGRDLYTIPAATAFMLEKQTTSV
eukprot:TRINITY_DN6174_c0_g1_i2.p1 TRINITY_DN6174_c0_g1~~TRINITY_DN6174_c0_g1_i2.p1  ORF type:complete len:256 (+),score=51.75 TRINITY_DN6174_c0_g1_i2:22-789(+)